MTDKALSSLLRDIEYLGRSIPVEELYDLRRKFKTEYAIKILKEEVFEKCQKL